MRKAVALVACLMLFTACKAKDEAVVLENPQQTFDEMTAENREAWKDAVLELLPEMEKYEKSKSTFSLSGSADTGASGKAEFAFDADSESDITDAENPKVKSALNISANIDGEPFKGNAKANLVLIVANASVFMSLKELTVDFPAFPTSEIIDPIREHIGKWYGDSFTTLSERTGTDIKSTYLSRINNPAGMREKIGNLIANTPLFTMKSFSGEENGFYKFEVTLDEAGLRTMLEEVMKLSATPADQASQTLREFDENMEDIEIAGTLALLKDEPKYFTFDGTITDSSKEQGNGTIVASVLEDKKSLTMNKSGEEVVFTVEHQQDETNNVTITQKKADGEAVTLMNGSVSETSISATVYNQDSSDEQMQLALTKTGDTWAGTLKGTEGEETIFTMEISNLTIEKDSFHMELLVKDDSDAELAQATVDYTTEEADSISIVSPESFEQFGTLLENFQPLMMMGAPGMVPAQPSLDISPMPDATEAAETSSTEVEAEAETEGSAGIPPLPFSAEGLTPEQQAEIQKQLEALDPEQAAELQKQLEALGGTAE